MDPKPRMRGIAAGLGLAVAGFCAASAYAPAAHAVPILTAHQDFASGGAFNGQLTFTDDYSHITAVDGYLTGGPYSNDHVNWVWTDANSLYAGGYPYGGNFLMTGMRNGPGGGNGSYTWFISFTWDYSGAPTITFANVGVGNNVQYTDPMVSGSLSPAVVMPEPSTLALLVLGVGLPGLTLYRRKPQSSEQTSRPRAAIA